MWLALVIGLLTVGLLASWLLRREELPKLTPPTECRVREGFVSVIVPAYNEGDGIKLTLSTISELAQEKSFVEIIVVDAGCKDHTMEAVHSMKLDVKLRTTKSAGGRGPAMNAGARTATGDIFLFVHADTVVPRGFDAELRNAFQDPEVLMTAFRFGVNRALLRGKEPKLMALMEKVVNHRTRTFHLPYGDQAFGFTAHKFRAMGGFPDFVMMEDFEVARRLRREERAGGGKIVILDQAALCAPRRWEEKGVLRNSVQNVTLAMLFVVARLSPEQIFRLYYGRPPPEKEYPVAAPLRG